MAKRILVLDIETTGFLNAGGSIVEIGIVELNLDNGIVKTIYNSLCREDILNKSHRAFLDYQEKGLTPPKSAKGWIFANSYLTPEQVREAPHFDKVKTEVQAILDQYPLGVTAFNNKFDFGFLIDRGIRIENKLPCPMILATNVCKIPNPWRGGYKWPNVEEAYKHFYPKSTYVEKHRGADDALHEAMIVYKLYELGVFKLN